MKKLKVKIFTEFEEFRALAGVWDGLLQKCGSENTLYLTHERLFTWWQHLGVAGRLNIVLVEKGKQIVAIVPLMKLEYKLLFLKLHVLENIEAENCNYVWICPPENRGEVIAVLLAYFKKELKSSLALKLRMVPGDSQFLSLLNEQDILHHGDFLLQVKLATLAPYVKLPETWREYSSTLSRKRRAVLRQALRQIEQDSHRLSFGEYTAASLEDGLSEFFTLHQERWKSVGVRSPFSKPEMSELYSDFVRRFSERGWLHFSYLALDGQVVSSLLGAIYDRKFYASLIARDKDYAEYSVGHLHFMHVLKEAIGEKLREFDFLKGDEPYKFYWTKTSREYLRVVLASKSLVSRLYLTYLSLGSLFKLLKKHGLRNVVHAFHG